MNDETVVRGGCLCGGVRFEARGPASAPVWCHCRMCQRSSGAPAQPSAGFPADAMTWLGVPAVYRSSEKGRRLFCARCGSQLGFDDGQELSLTLGAFDDPEPFEPTAHIWCESRLSWFPEDDLPRHGRDG